MMFVLWALYIEKVKYKENAWLLIQIKLYYDPAR